MRRNRRKRAERSVMGFVLIGAVGAALAGFALAAFFLRPPALDPDTLCRLDRPATAHTLILIDATDALERRHRRRLEALAGQERARLAQYDRLTLMRLDARRPHEPAIVFSKCLPLPPEKANPLFQNPKDARAAWDRTFAEALSRALSRASGGRAQNASPIIAGLRAAAGEPSFAPEAGARRLVVVSDFLEHDPEGFSHYADGSDFAAWEARDARGAPDFTGVAVRLAPVDRPGLDARQAAALAEFWPQFFDASGAAPVSIDPSF